MRRVVITGVGVISPHGIGTSAFWNALLESKSSITTLTRFDPSAFDCHVAGVVPPFKTTDYVPKSYRKATKIMATDIQLAVTAADFAVRDARLITRGTAEGTPEGELEKKGWYRPNPARMGCNIGAGLVSVDMDELTGAMVDSRNPDNSLSLAQWGRSDDPSKTSGMERLTPLWMLKFLPNMLACHVSIIHDTQGPSNAITGGEASAGLAMAEATRTIQRGQADLALVGGCESKVHPMGIMRWSLLKRLNGRHNDNPKAACRPYDGAAGGGVLAEGGAVVDLEVRVLAKRRGATIYAELTGFGLTACAQASTVEPDATGESPAMAMSKALKDAGIAAADVGMLIPPGNGAPDLDRADLAAIRKVFGACHGLSIFPARGGVGNCGAGSQAMDLAAAALSLREQVVPGAVNVEHPIDHLPIAPQKAVKNLTHVMVLASALGGMNSAVVLKRAG